MILMRFGLRPLLLLAALTATSSCTFERPRTSMKLLLGRPDFPSGFKCVGVMVTGEGIPSQDRTNDKADWEGIYGGKTCFYPGISTSVKAIGTSAAETEMSFELLVPTGKLRTVQVIGVTSTAATCPNMTLSDLVIANRAGQLPSGVTGYYELGRTYTSTLQPQIVDVKKNYDSAKAVNLAACDPPPSGGSGGSGSGLAFPFTELTLFYSDRITLSALGGSGSYRYEVDGVALSTALYQAPAVTTNATLRVIDNLTAKDASVTLSVVDPQLLGTLKFWYTARSFAGAKQDGDTIGASDVWGNSAPVSLNLSHSTGLTSTIYHEKNAPQGLPSVSLARTGFFHIGNINAALNGSFYVIVVARQTSNQTSGLFTLANSTDFSSATIGLSVGVGVVPERGFLKILAVDPYTLENAPEKTYDGWGIFRAEQRSQTPYNGAMAFANSTTTDRINHGNTSFNPVGNLILGAESVAGVGVVGAGSDLEIAEVMAFEASYNVSGIYDAFKKKYGLK